ncbi:MAG: hypothetical protein Q4F84_02590 [Fibrobacter sp.]|nr:hypothetical protein [Fibrobacter sp.]
MFTKKKSWFYPTIKALIMLRVIYGFASYFLKSAEKRWKKDKKTDCNLTKAQRGSRLIRFLLR